MGSMIEFERPDGSRCAGYLSSAGQDRPGVIVIQEWWGLNAQIRGVADRFAQAGFTALAPDLFHGRVAQDVDEAGHLMNGLDYPGAVHQDIRGAALRLAGQCGKVGIMGYCMGGALAIAAAVHVPEVSAAVCFYGMPPREFADPAAIRIPFQGHFARRDNWVTPQLVHELEVAMDAAGQRPELFSYDADHAFCNETRPEVYDADSAALSWGRMTDFFTRTLAA
jgi:carboxymethylenebutenolidase